MIMKMLKFVSLAEQDNNPTDWETAMESIPDHFDDTDPKLVIFSLYKNVLFKEYFMLECGTHVPSLLTL